MNKTISVFVLITALLAAGGCGKTSPAPKPQPQASQPVKVDRELVGKIKRAVKTVPGVREAVVVVINHEVSAAIEVTGLDRLELKQIRSEVHGQIKKMVPGYVVRVTSDKKLYSQLQQVENEIARGQPPANLPAIIKEINQKMNG